MGFLPERLDNKGSFYLFKSIETVLFSFDD
jgi:hypothetical protein